MGVFKMVTPARASLLGISEEDMLKIKLKRDQFLPQFYLLRIHREISEEAKTPITSIKKLLINHNDFARIGLNSLLAVIPSSRKMMLRKVKLIRGCYQGQFGSSDIISLTTGLPSLGVVTLDFVGTELWIGNFEKDGRSYVEPLARLSGKQKFTKVDIKNEAAILAIRARAAQILEDTHRTLEWGNLHQNDTTGTFGRLRIRYSSPNPMGFLVNVYHFAMMSQEVHRAEEVTNCEQKVEIVEQDQGLSAVAFNYTRYFNELQQVYLGRQFW
jgi:hypothetical protein